MSSMSLGVTGFRIAHDAQNLALLKTDSVLFLLDHCISTPTRSADSHAVEFSDMIYVVVMVIIKKKGKGGDSTRSF